MYIHVKCNAPLNGFIARDMAQINTVIYYYYYFSRVTWIACQLLVHHDHV